MPALELTPAQRKEHRAGAHHLHPVVQVGADGLTPAVVKEIDGALKAHGLIKVRVFSDDRLAREALLADIADRLGAAPIQHIGKLLVLWRPQPDKSAAADERADRKPGPRVIKLVKFSKSGNHRATVKKIKVLGNELRAHPELVRRFEREARAAASLSSPHAVRIYDIDKTEDGTPFSTDAWTRGPGAGTPKTPAASSAEGGAVCAAAVGGGASSSTA